MDKAPEQPGAGTSGQPGASATSPPMDKGARALVLLFVGALAVGTVVVAAHPGYRAALRSMLRGGGGDSASPVWRSNARYYEAIR